LAGYEIDLRNKAWRASGGMRRSDLRFNYNLSGVFKIGRKKGKWVYRSGKITATHLGFKPMFNPAKWWDHKPPVCTGNCGVVKARQGKKLHANLISVGGGKLHRIKFHWGSLIPRARMWSRLKSWVGCQPMPQCRQDVIYKGLSRLYTSTVFFAQIIKPAIWLQNGTSPPFKRRNKQVSQGRAHVENWLEFRYTLTRLK